MALQSIPGPESRGESDSDSDSEDSHMNEFLSRFTWAMRGKVAEAYPDSDKETVNGMLSMIAGKVVAEMEKGGVEKMRGEAAAAGAAMGGDLSEELWRTMWDVSVGVMEEMKKERKKREMRKYIHSDEVKEMVRFAGEVGIRGDLLRELRFKWAQERMEEVDFYRGLDRMRDDDHRIEDLKKKRRKEGNWGRDIVAEEEEEEEEGKGIAIPRRIGKYKFKIYGMDLSDPKWEEVADRIHRAEKFITPDEAKPITGKCKLVNEKILSLSKDDDPTPLLAEWEELLRPTRIDWINLLNGVKERNLDVHLKLAEIILGDESFQANISDFSKLVAEYAKENRIEDAERILKKMTGKGIQPDVLTSAMLVRMYSKAGNLELAKHAFESIRNQGFKPSLEVYNAMITAYVKAGEFKLGESLMREMETWGIKPTKKIYTALLKAFAEHGDVAAAQRIATSMQFAGFPPTLESATLLIQAFANNGDEKQARNQFDYILKLGHKPDDSCTASMISAYEKRNRLDQATTLLIELEKDGFEPGVKTYTVLVDWFAKLLLVKDVEALLQKITEKGDTPPFKVNVSLCDMYARLEDRKKALQALGIVEGKKELLKEGDFERIINGLKTGGLIQEALRMYELMQACGFVASESLKFSLRTSQTFQRQRPTEL
ncbi:hypothetical protein Syun_024481 [Stephania yunnanensis]|uniref:Pentacotripeptide-repeat region of PRORP domain-containing protein n=1 Tax=Stephania yunnanensis TaxID=152371 RepID=A0AAP0I4G1_9MAGN